MVRIVFATAVCALCLASPDARAGAANAQLHCVSPSGDARIALAGDIPGDFASFELRLSDATATTTMSDRDERISVIENFAKGVFTIAGTRSDDRNLLLYALPASIKRILGPNREFRAKFSAVLLEAPRPGRAGPVSHDSTLRNIRLSCAYEYAI